jgi:hypothetical protein
MQDIKDADPDAILPEGETKMSALLPHRVYVLRCPQEDHKQYVYLQSLIPGIRHYFPFSWMLAILFLQPRIKAH